MFTQLIGNHVLQVFWSGYFYLRPLLQRQMGSLTFKVDFSRLLLVLEVWDVHPTYRKRCDASLLKWSVLTSNPSFKVKWHH